MGLVVLLEAFWGHFIDLNPQSTSWHRLNQVNRQMEFLFWCWSPNHSIVPLIFSTARYRPVRVVGISGLVHINTAVFSVGLSSELPSHLIFRISSPLGLLAYPLDSRVSDMTLAMAAGHCSSPASSFHVCRANGASIDKSGA
jgi:hypothetical protein